MTAHVSPIATQETAEEIKLHGKIDHEANAWYIAPLARMPPPYLRQTKVEVTVDWDSAGGFAGLEIFWDAQPDRDALSSVERRIEELVRERDEAEEAMVNARRSAEDVQSDAMLWQYSVAVGDRPPLLVAVWKRATAAEALVATLKAEVEELKRRPDMLKQLLDDANAAHFDATMRADAAESRLASLTGQVEDMRAAGGHALDTLQAFLDTFGDLGDRVTQADIEDWRAAFALPVLPTTGDGPTGRETSGEET